MFTTFRKRVSASDLNVVVFGDAETGSIYPDRAILAVYRAFRGSCRKLLVLDIPGFRGVGASERPLWPRIARISFFRELNVVVFSENY